jgi:hypothetical protein
LFYEGKHGSMVARGSCPSWNWNLENVDFGGERKTGEPEKNPRSKGRINNKLNSHTTPSPRIEPGATVVRGERLLSLRQPHFTYTNDEFSLTKHW